MIRNPELCLAVLITCSSSICCSTTTSTFMPPTARPHEIVIGYDDGLTFAKDGSTFELDDLPRIVDCVPAARLDAASANTARAVSLTVLLAGTAGFLGGGALLIANALAPDEAHPSWPGLGILIGGAVTQVVSAFIDSTVMPKRLDAINRYNDEQSSSRGCDTPTPSRLISGL